MKRIYKLFLSAALLLSVASSQAQELHQSVVPIPSKSLVKSRPRGEFNKELIYMLQLNNRYTLNKWYNDLKKFNQQDGEYLDFAGKNEADIRPTSHHVFALATSLRAGLYSEKVTGVDKEEAMEILSRLISSAAYRHRANYTGKNAWGRHWQSAMWSAQISTGAWFVWDKLSPETQELVAKMTVYEADRFINYKIPYYRDLDGNIIFEGDTKAEENAWNSGAPAIAMVMMPNHPNYEKWRRATVELQISAYSTPDDLHNDSEVDGVKVSEMLKGSNVANDGTAINHKILHPDYMSAIMFNITNYWVFELAKIKPLDSSLFNGELVYSALVSNKYNGKTIYQTDEKGKALHTLYFPEGNDWGGERQANYWLMDIMGNYFDWCDDGSVEPLDWAKIRNKEMLRMMNRDTTGQYYQSKKEDRFFSREEWIGQHLAWGYIGMWLERKH